MDAPLFADDTAPAADGDVVEVDPVRLFLNRWAFNWRCERAVIEMELRDLIAKERTVKP